jgi:DNA invertase Pin-like site-specific DNA recombinase
MIIGYARTSTDRQTHDLQLNALTDAGCERIFIETASGAARERPELAAALDYVRTGDVLCVWKLDRLARSLPQLLTTAAELEARQIGLRSLTEDIRTDTPTGRLVFHLLGALGQFERDIIRERVRAGIEAAKAKGKVGGRPRVLDDVKLKAARTLLVAGELSVAEVAKQVGCSVTSLYRQFPRARSDAGQWESAKLSRTPSTLTN